MSEPSDYTKCPRCGGPTNHDRELPPNPYVCDECDPDHRLPSDTAKRIAEAVCIAADGTADEIAETISTNGLAELEQKYYTAQMNWEEQREVAGDLEARLAAAEMALGKINDIRNSIIGTQQLNWSAHIYPLVAALNEAGIEGAPYPDAKKYMGTLIEQRDEARAGAAFIMSAHRSGETVAFGHCEGCDDAYRKLGWVERLATTPREGEGDG